MLDECAKDIDVVLIATPDHNHAPAAIRAINLGKHVFCQKPLAHNIYECYALAKAAKEKKVLTQMGNQGIARSRSAACASTSGPAPSARHRGPHDPGPQLRRHRRPAAHQARPAGPALGRVDRPRPVPRLPRGLHPFNWRNWRAFGTGTIGDMACHWLDFPFWGLKVCEVKKFTVKCLDTKGGSEEMYPSDNVVRYDLPAHGSIPAVKCFVYDHTPKPFCQGAGEEVQPQDSSSRARSSSATRATSPTTPGPFPTNW